jgi:hypothetical protein
MSSAQRSDPASNGSTGALANPIDGVDVNLLDTSDWTVDDWRAAVTLDQLRNNAAKGEYNQGSIQSM